jgi:hypothetical protein
VGIDLKRLIRLITDRAHEIFCIDCVGAYSRAIPCAERSAVFHTLFEMRVQKPTVYYTAPYE